MSEVLIRGIANPVEMEKLKEIAKEVEGRICREITEYVPNREEWALDIVCQSFLLGYLVGINRNKR